jgi:hypothetical protein
LQLELAGRPDREPARPGIAKPADPGPLARTLRLVAVEQTALQHHRSGPHPGHRDGALENLSQVVIHRIAKRGARHWIVGAERGESLPRGKGHAGPLIELAEQVVERKHQLVDVGVRVTPVDEPFAPRTGRKLTLGNGETFEVQSGQQAEAVRELRPREP